VGLIAVRYIYTVVFKRPKKLRACSVVHHFSPNRRRFEDRGDNGGRVRLNEDLHKKNSLVLTCPVH
jgi:hypothetical protein